MIIWQLLGRVHTLTEKRKAKKLKPIRTRGKTGNRQAKCTAYYYYCEFRLASAFPFSVFPSRYESGLSAVTIWTIIISSNYLNTIIFYYHFK